MIKQDTIDRVLALDICEVMKDYVTLKKSGAGYVCKCPFHDDSSPSLQISPAKQVWKCFVCGHGGGPVKFVMEYENISFAEAIRTLAQKHGIPCEEEELSDAERAKAQKRDSMYANYEIVQQYYCQNLQNKDPLATAAREYAYGRWGEELCIERGIGFAYPGSELMKFAKERISDTLLSEMSLTFADEKKGTKIDFFRNRITIPIEDRWGRVVGYTARVLNSDAKPKYLNCCNTELYKKSVNIFGIHQALKGVGKAKKFYLVEGAPDVLRLYMIGIPTAVATLGSRWNETQFKQLKGANTLCFLPDADVLKPGEQFSAGTKGVMDSGKLALSLGFECFVKVIPQTEDGGKNDADSYCTTLEIFNALEEQDFVEWYAVQYYACATSPKEKSRAFSEVADLLASIPDKVQRNAYVEIMAERYGDAEMWQDEVASRASKLPSSGMKVEDTQPFGFYISPKHYYYALTGRGQERQLSEFTLDPIYHIIDSISPLRTYKVTTYRGLEIYIELKQSDLTSASKFRERMAGQCNVMWLGKDEDLINLQRYLNARTPSARKFDQLGWQRKGFYAFGNGIFYNDQFYLADEQGGVSLGDLGNYYLPAMSNMYMEEESLFSFERNFSHRDLNSISFHDYAKLIVDVFGTNAMVGISFVLATVFHDVIATLTERFPLLNIYGQKGSGKSELAMCLTAFFYNDTRPSSLTNTSLPSMADKVGQVANACVHFDEYKNDIDNQCVDFLKSIWDRNGRAKKDMDRDKKVVQSRMDSGVIITGQEMPTIDIALFSRLVYLVSNRTEYTADEKRRFERLKEVRSLGCSHLTIRLLTNRHLFEKNYKRVFKEVGDLLLSRLGDQIVEDRVFYNWRVVLAADKTLRPVLDFPYDFDTLTEVCVEGMIQQNAGVKSNNEIAKFWQAVLTMFQEDALHRRADFHIKVKTRIKPIGKEEVVFNPEKRLFFLNYGRVVKAYVTYLLSLREKPLSRESLLQYLLASKECLGKIKSMRFDQVTKDGIRKPTRNIVKDKPIDSYESYPAQAFVFDYDALKEHYEVNFEIEEFHEGDDDD